MSTTILLLDDDKRMFNAINRLVRPLNAVVLATASPVRALSFCEDYDVQIVIADINRQDVNVNDFLRQVSDKNMLTRKIVLTSFAELNTTADAINQGKINRYFTKPWDPDELREAITSELEEYDNQVGASSQMKSLGKQQAKMVEKVDFTTRLLNGTTELLSASQYRASIRIMTTLLEQRLPGSTQHSKKTAKTAVAIAKQMGLDSKACQKVSMAAELHLLGMLALPDALLTKSFEDMTADEQAVYIQYPEHGAQALGSEGDDTAVEDMIRHHQEDNDGNGFPHQLVAAYIPLGARIVRVASDFETEARELGGSLALLNLLRDRGEMYDPAVIDALTEVKLDSSVLPNNQDLTEIRPCN